MRITLEKSGPNVFAQAAAQRRQAARAKQRAAALAAEPAVESRHPTLAEFRREFPERYARHFHRGDWLLSAAREEFQRIQSGAVKRHIAF